MATGRWLDDAYSGAPRAASWPHPKFDRYVKRTWPAAIIIGLVFTGLTPVYGWLIGVVAWAVSCHPVYRKEAVAYNRRLETTKDGVPFGAPRQKSR